MKKSERLAPEWTKEKVIDLLEKNPKAVEKALILIYNRQTNDEKNCENTIVNNGIGFRPCDAPSGTYMAEWVKSGKPLNGKFLLKAKEMMKHYTRQLIEEIEIKAKGA
jgi:hypothetical protein